MPLSHRVVGEFIPHTQNFTKRRLVFGSKAGRREGLFDEGRSELTQQFKNNFCNWLKVVSDQNAHRYKLEGPARYVPQDIKNAVSPA